MSLTNLFEPLIDDISKASEFIRNPDNLLSNKIDDLGEIELLLVPIKTGSVTSVYHTCAKILDNIISYNPAAKGGFEKINFSEYISSIGINNIYVYPRIDNVICTGQNVDRSYIFITLDTIDNINAKILQIEHHYKERSLKYDFFYRRCDTVSLYIICTPEDYYGNSMHTQDLSINTNPEIISTDKSLYSEIIKSAGKKLAAMLQNSMWMLLIASYSLNTMGQDDVDVSFMFDGTSREFLELVKSLHPTFEAIDVLGNIIKKYIPTNGYM